MADTADAFLAVTAATFTTRPAGVFALHMMALLPLHMMPRVVIPAGALTAVKAATSTTRPTDGLSVVFAFCAVVIAVTMHAPLPVMSVVIVAATGKQQPKHGCKKQHDRKPLHRHSSWPKQKTGLN